MEAEGKKPEEIEEQLPPPPSPEALERAERLIREARLLKMRGNKTSAGKLLEEALEIAPGSAAILEAVADDLVERRQIRAAMEIYKRAMRIDPQSASIERKYAECVLGTARSLDFPSPGAEGLDQASGKIALLLSLFVPGLGQIVTGATGLGVGLLVGWLAGWGIAWLIPGGMQGVLGLFGVRGHGPTPEFNGVVLFPLLLAAICHIWAIFDAAGKANRYQRRPIERPVPPVDKDFEL